MHFKYYAFELWCWRRLLRVPWTARSNQWILKEISPEYSLEGLMLKLKTPTLCPPDGKNRLIWKDPDAGKDWGQEEKWTTEDETVGWHHRLNGHGFGWTPGVGDGQGSLACCSSWGCRELDMTEWLNWTESTETTFVEITPKICMSPNPSLVSQPLLDFCALWDTVHHCLLYLFMTTACGTLVPQPGMKPVPSAVSVWSPNHWTLGKSLLLPSFRKIVLSGF